MKDPDQKLPTISLCMIVKNEEENLALALDSVKDYVDEILITDTGSTDRTVEIAREYTDKVSYFEWCDDFAAARNYSIKDAKMDWILVWDADEVADRQSMKDLKGFLSSLAESVELISWKNINIQKSDIYRIEEIKSELIDKGYSHFHLRMIKNNGLNHFEDNLHEIVRSQGIKVLSNLIKYHFGFYDHDQKNRLQRNLSCAIKGLNKDPDNVQARINLAKSWALVDNYPSMLEHLLAALKILARHDPPNTMMIKTVYSIILFFLSSDKKYHQLGLDFAKSWKRMQKDQLLDVDPYYYSGKILFLNNRFEEALKEFETVLQNIDQQVIEYDLSLHSKMKELSLSMVNSIINNQE